MEDGYYTIADPNGTPRTFRVLTREQDARTLRGKQVVSFLGRKDTYKQFATIIDGGLRPFLVYHDTTIMQAAHALVDGGAEIARESALAYARQTMRCFVCGKLLTDELSVQQGYGPICKPFAEYVLHCHEKNPRLWDA